MDTLNPAIAISPLSEKERFTQIDILRGVALLGVLLVNLLMSFRISLFAHIIGSDAPLGPAGSIVSTFVSEFVEFKAITLFSFLFGVGIAIQAQRLCGRMSLRIFLARRFSVLFLFGLVHVIFVWNGDILMLYAICGWLTISMLGLPVRALVAIGAVLAIGSAYVNFPIHFPGGAESGIQAAAAARVYSQGSFAEILAFRFQETRQLILPLLILTLLRTWGIVLLGIAAQRSGFMCAPRQRFGIGLILGAVAGVAATYFQLEVVALLAIAFAYGSGILFWFRRAPFLAAGGQMALTNYLAQSVVFGFVFYGYGLKQFGHLALLPCALGGIGFYLVQLGFSRWWLRRFYFGPCEWLWRSLTYGRSQPMLRPRPQPTFARDQVVCS
jgi:uncharacterized protein